MVRRLTGVTQITAGSYDTCAVLTTARIKCWGLGRSGQLGDGLTVNEKFPVYVSGIASALQVSGGGYHTCAVLASRRVECWGQGHYGQLGDESRASTKVPVYVSSLLANAVQVAAGKYHTCALNLAGGGIVECWGRGNDGQLGNGGMATHTTPVLVAGVTGATQIAVGAFHSCALLSTHQIKSWGHGTSGQLGNDAASDSATEVVVVKIATATQIAAGAYHTCTLLKTGNVECWGRGVSGQLGNNQDFTEAHPVLVR